MQSVHTLNRMLNLEGKDKHHAIIYHNLTTGECCVTNIRIFPEIYRYPMDNILKNIYDNQVGLRFEDRAIFEFVYGQLSSIDALNGYLQKEPISVSVDMNNGDNNTDYTQYDFVFNVYQNDNGEFEVLTFVSCKLATSSKCSIDEFEDYVKSKMYCSVGVQAIIQFDISGFKVLNEKYGEAYCDSLLEFISECFKIMLGGSFKFVNYYGDVFIIFFECKQEAEIKQVISEWQTVILGFGDINYRINWGIYVLNKQDKQTYRSVVDRAALARQQIKYNALNNIGVYTEACKTNLDNRYNIETCMRPALRDGEFKVYIQPKYSMTKNIIIGGEALIRWVHEGALLTPSLFIPILEQNGFICEVDKFVWREVCKLLSRQKNPLPISVNVSRKHFDDGEFEFVDFLDSLISEYGIDKKLLELEITESVDVDDISKCVQLLKERGYTLLMDDFGSGYSSLTLLKDSQFDVIKLDKGFLDELLGSQKGQKILAHTIAMIHSVHLNIVAEGIEFPEQVNFLVGAGCDVAQGFLYSKPIPLETYEKLTSGDTKAEVE